jgi:hypothetical protein
VSAVRDRSARPPLQAAVKICIASRTLFATAPPARAAQL